MDLDETVFDADFITDNLADIEDAMDGDVKAAERVRQAYAKDIFNSEGFQQNLEVRLNNLGFTEDLEYLKSAAASAFSEISDKLSNIPAGVDISDMQNDLTNLINTVATSTEEA
jgi:hypothetical protein